MYYTNDHNLIEDFHLRSGHSVSSKKSYRTVFNKYTAFHNMSLCDLLAEAITEQENHTPENRLSIYDRIISFRLIQGLSNQKSYRKHNYRLNI